MATTTSLSTPLLSSILNPRPRYSLNPLTFHPSLSSKRIIPLHNPPHEIPLKPTQIRRISAVSGDSLPLEANPVENSEQIVSGGDDTGFTIISVLLFIAFIGLSVLTIGIIYIAVTDFLQKREREKFEKEEAAKKKKKSGKKGVVRSRAGPRGFGQKIEGDDEDF
ncbi:hypothetical protein HYC85_031717 [Camellia sinensis]|uniref:Transmembrane protein n=1 Tax=Camellia sinensis TaxID=4442 RepID=A0A7J7FV66_CAMSI|nr:hypothetical protein HYC85_031717 [Camellia sinensis]